MGAKLAHGRGWLREMCWRRVRLAPQLLHPAMAVLLADGLSAVADEVDPATLRTRLALALAVANLVDQALGGHERLARLGGDDGRRRAG